MHQNNSFQNSLLKVRSYLIHFPTGYKFMLRVPEQITVRQITEIIKSYKALHNEYGLKREGKNIQPIALSSLDGNLVSDLYLVEPCLMEYQLGIISTREFKVQYHFHGNEKIISNSVHGQSRNFEFLGKPPRRQDLLQKQSSHQNFQYVARSHKDCKLYLVHKLCKSFLNFSKLQEILTMRDYFMKNSFTNFPHFPPISSTFQTSQSLCIVTPLYPFQATKIFQNSKHLMDIIVTQIAKIIHILQRDKILTININSSHFWLDFKLQVVYCGIYQFQTENDREIGGLEVNRFGSTMIRVLEDLLTNLNIKQHEKYSLLIDNVKKNRITNYLQFLKYFPMSQIFLSSFSQNMKRKDLLKQVIKNYKFMHLVQLNHKEKQEFLQNYQPKTNLFVSTTKKIENCQYNYHSAPNESQKPKKILEQIIENISTIKKKKNGVHIEVNPIFLTRAFLKEEKNKIKTKKYQTNQNLNKSNKTNKSKIKHQRKISEFLIDD